jgi:hypothetical protein
VQAFQAQAAQQNKSIFNSPNQGQIINLQMPQQQIIHLKQADGSLAQQIIQVKPNSDQSQTPLQQTQQVGQIVQGPNGIFQLLQPLQDTQETLLIPNQPIQQAFITPSGQIIRGPLMSAAGNFIQNMPQTVQLPNGE